jgi:hypothetical protein
LNNLFDLSGKTAIVTGGSRGIGRAICIRLAQHGAKVVVASRKLDACQAVVDEITANGGTGFIYFPILNYADGNLDFVEGLLDRDDVVISLSDGGAHCGALGKLYLFDGRRLCLRYNMPRKPLAAKDVLFAHGEVDAGDGTPQPELVAGRQVGYMRPFSGSVVTDLDLAAGFSLELRAAPGGKGSVTLAFETLAPPRQPSSPTAREPRPPPRPPPSAPLPAAEALVAQLLAAFLASELLRRAPEAQRCLK